MGGDLMGMNSMMMSMMVPSKPDQILYNPMIDGKAVENSAASSIKIRNAAAPGSLLKVWEGTLDVGGGSMALGTSANDSMIDC